MSGLAFFGFRGSLPSAAVVLFVGTVFGGSTQAAVAQAAVRYTVDRQTLIDGTREELSYVNAIRAVPAGGMSFTELAHHVVRVVGADGQAVASIGARGAGPGEFRMITDHGWIGDSLWVLDRQLRRTTFFHSDGTLLGTLPWPAQLTWKTASASGQDVRETPIPVRHLPGGAVMMEVSFERSNPVAAGLPPDIEYALFETTTTGSISSLIIAASRLRVCEIGWSDGNLSGAIPIPFCAHNVVAVSPNGRRVILAEQGGRLGEGQVRLLVHNSRGVAQADMSLVFPLIQTPTRLVESEIAKLTRGSALDSGSRRRREALDRMPRAKVFPPFGRVLISDAGHVWLQRWTATGDHAWVSLQPERGRALIPLELPKGFIPTTLLGHGAWGNIFDSDGVPSVAFVSRQ